MEHVFELASYAEDHYTCGMLANSQTAGCQLHPLATSVTWRPVDTPIKDRSSMPSGVALKDTLVASTFLCAYMALYLAVGFVALSAVEWVWTYLAN